MIDLRNFNNITYNATSQTAVIGTGNLLGDIVIGLNSLGRALPHGTCAYVGWGGHSSTHPDSPILLSSSGVSNTQAMVDTAFPRVSGVLRSTT